MRRVQASSLPTWLRSDSVRWAGAILALVVVALTAAFLLREAQLLETNEVQSVELYARVLQDHTERTFNTIDIAMASLAETVGGDPATVDTRHLNQDLTTGLKGLPFIRSLSLLSAEGDVLASSSAAAVGLQIDLGALRLPHQQAVDQLGVSVKGRDLGDLARGRAAPSATARTFVPLVRAIERPNGSRLYLVAVLNPDFFANEHELTLADSSRAAGVFSIDASMLAGTGNLRMAPGDSAAGHRFFTAYLPARESGSDVGPGLDGNQVITAFRVLRQRPLVVIVERDHAQVRAAFRHTVIQAIGSCVAVILVILTLVLMAWRSLKGHEVVSAALASSQRDIASNERDLRVLVESVHELIFRADAEGRIVFVNGRWQQLTKRPASDVLGRRFAELCRDDERPACDALFRDHDAPAEAIQIHVQAADGSHLTLDLSVARVLDNNGSVTAFAGFAVDVSARELAKQALESQLRFTGQLLELSPTPIFVKDEAGRFVTVNRAWLDLTGLPLVDVQGKTSAELGIGDAARHREEDLQLLRTGQRVSYESKLRVGDRGARDTVVTKVRFTHAHGAAVGIVGSIVDVTEFREAERNVRRARDAAQLASRAKSEFIENITHELRTPLQGILGFSELGRDLSDERPELQEMFTDIQGSGRRMLKLVNALLDVSQMDSAPGSIPLARADVAQLVQDTVDQCGPQLRERGLRISVHGTAEPVEADVDPIRFQQAVRNILSNAMKYSPAHADIDVRLKDRGAAGVELVVRDRGPGIPAEELELIFDAFVQSSRTQDGSGGTGLGLTIARKILSAHGGTIVAANADDGGALFTMSLPVAGDIHTTRRPAHGSATHAPEVI